MEDGSGDYRLVLAACREANIMLSKENAELEDKLRMTRSMLVDHRKEIRELRAVHAEAGKLIKDSESKVKKLQTKLGRKS